MELAGSRRVRADDDSRVRAERTAAAGSPWQQTDVGDVGIAGSATVGSDADLFINGAGSDIWGTTDSFHFVYQTMYDGEIGTSAGPSLQNTHPHAKIGLMIRLTVAADSPHVVLDLQPDGSVEFMQRATAGVETTFIGGVAGGVSPGMEPASAAVERKDHRVCVRPHVVAPSEPRRSRMDPRWSAPSSPAPRRRSSPAPRAPSPSSSNSNAPDRRSLHGSSTAHR